MTLDTPIRTGTTRRRWAAPVVAPGILLGLLYSALASWSVGQEYGGTDDDGGYIDFWGHPTSTPPPTIDVRGHPALWVFVVLAAILVAAAYWASHVEGRIAARRLAVGFTTAAVFLSAVVVVFSGVQSRLVEDAMTHGDQHPPVLGLGTVTVTVSHTRTG